MRQISKRERCADGCERLAEVADAWARCGLPLWRRQTDVIHARLAARWLPCEQVGTLLKTDLFEEFTDAGLVGELAPRARRIIGVDVSPTVVAGAAGRQPELDARVADVRSLPFPNASIDAIVSTSTLDHFAAADDLVCALRELRRVLRPGGRLVLTLDNPRCPPVAVRHRLPSGLAHALMRVRFEPGWACDQRRLRRLLSQAGFDVREMSAVLHFPRIALDLADRALRNGRTGHGLRERALRLALACERLERVRSRFFTGHYLAVLATPGASHAA